MKDDIRFGYRVRGSYMRRLEDYVYRRRTDNIMVHCSADAEEDGIGDTAEDIRTEHLRQGWMDIGYHFVIERDGTICRGRPPLAVGSGARGWNHNSLHICMIGGADKRGRGENDFTAEQWMSLCFLVTEAARAYPKARIMGHRDIWGSDPRNWQKECPSFDVKSWWQSCGEPVLGLPVDGEEPNGIFQ